jgi:ATP-dependent DNA helicase RecQ
VDGAVRRVSGGWAATGAGWAYDADRYARVAAERSREQQAMLDYAAAGACRMEYLRRELDDPAAAPCGRCDNCTGRHWPQEVSQAAAGAASDRLLRPGVEITPRRMWPTGMRELGVEVSGRIDPGLSAEPGRAIGRLTDLGWGPRLRALLASDGSVPDGPSPDHRVPDDGASADHPAPDDGASADHPVPDDLVAAVVKVLAAWDWDQRPAGVVTLPSRTRPQLVESLGLRIAEIGRIPHLGALGYSADARPSRSAGRQHNSAQRLAAVWRELTVPDDVAAAAGRLEGPVLLVDDRVETGWTMTVAARLLRQAGAPAVLPLALAISTG